jgi:hypothetical protein
MALKILAQIASNAPHNKVNGTYEPDFYLHRIYHSPYLRPCQRDGGVGNALRSRTLLLRVSDQAGRCETIARSHLPIP